MSFSQFNKHSNFMDTHAFLSPSSYHWVNYDEEKLVDRFNTWMMAERGTKLHALAKDLINLNVKLPRSRQTLNMYVNDAIGYRMTTEQPLVYSVNCYGTTDAISFRKNKLRIHDLKTGVSRVSMRQLEVYAALFCLEYKYRPGEIDMELRIYKDDEIEVYNPEPETIIHVIDTIKSFDRIIENLKEGGPLD